MYEIDRLKQKARAGEALTAREGLWLVEKANQCRSAVAELMTAKKIPHPMMVKMANENAEAALLACCLEVGEKEPPRGNQDWAEWGLNEPAPTQEPPTAGLEPVSVPECRFCGAEFDKESPSFCCDAAAKAFDAHFDREPIAPGDYRYYDPRQAQ